MRIAVAGATGRVGHHVVDVLEAAGHDVVAMSRSRGVDVVTGDGLAQALTGVECVIDAVGPAGWDPAATGFRPTAARNLHEHGEKAGVRRMVVVSIIAIEKFTAGYPVVMAAHERAMLSGPIPARALRAAQFHEFVAQLVEWGRQGDVSQVPRRRDNLIAARTVAEALVEMATDPAAVPGPTVDIAGPREESLVEAARLLVARRGDPVRIEGVSDPADPDHDLYEAGVPRLSPNVTLAGPTFADWLDSTS